MSKNVSRRAMLAGASAMPAVALAPAVVDPDPVFAAIERDRELFAASLKAYVEYDEARGTIKGPQPFELIQWRNRRAG